MQDTHHPTWSNMQFFKVVMQKYRTLNFSIQHFWNEDLSILHNFHSHFTKANKITQACHHGRSRERSRQPLLSPPGWTSVINTQLWTPQKKKKKAYWESASVLAFRQSSFTVSVTQQGSDHANLTNRHWSKPKGLKSLFSCWWGPAWGNRGLLACHCTRCLAADCGGEPLCTHRHCPRSMAAAVAAVITNITHSQKMHQAQTCIKYMQGVRKG